MAKRKIGSQIGNLIFNLISLRAGDMRHIFGKDFNKGYNFALDLITIGGLPKKLCTLKIAVVPVVGISRLPLVSFEMKNHLDVAFVESCKIYYKGEGGGFPQVQAMVSLVCSSCPWLILAPNVLQLCTNHFVLVFLQACVSDWSLSRLPNLISELQHAPLPFYSGASQETCLDFLLFRCFQFGIHIWVPQGVGSVSFKIPLFQFVVSKIKYICLVER